MDCPLCKAKTRVVRTKDGGSAIVRVRECACGFSASTSEAFMAPTPHPRALVQLQPSRTA